MEASKRFYLDQEGYEKKQAELTELTEKLNRILAKRTEISSQSTGTDDSVEKTSYDEMVARIIESINTVHYTLMNAKIVEKHNDANGINIGDVIDIDMHIDGEIEQNTIKLVGSECDIFAEIQEISLNSPLGQAIYRKKVGDKVSYEVNNETIEVVINNILDLDKENNMTR